MNLPITAPVMVNPPNGGYVPLPKSPADGIRGLDYRKYQHMEPLKYQPTRAALIRFNQAKHALGLT